MRLSTHRLQPIPSQVRASRDVLHMRTWATRRNGAKCSLRQIILTVTFHHPPVASCKRQTLMNQHESPARMLGSPNHPHNPASFRDDACFPPITIVKCLTTGPECCAQCVAGQSLPLVCLLYLLSTSKVTQAKVKSSEVFPFSTLDLI